MDETEVKDTIKALRTCAITADCDACMMECHYPVCADDLMLMAANHLEQMQKRLGDMKTSNALLHGKLKKMRDGNNK